MSSDNKPDIDKEVLYGRYQKQEDANLKLHTKAKHKALDIPMDEDMIQANKTTTVTNTGLGLLGVLGVAGLVGLVPSLLAAYLALRPADAPPAPPAPVPAAPVQQQPTEWTLEIYRQNDGKWQAKELPK